MDECLADYDKILELDPGNSQYTHKRKELAKQIDERNEKLKAEMIGKLKEVGNKVLGKFGMSLDNFKMVQDPATGGYSIKYEKWFVCCACYVNWSEGRLASQDVNSSITTRATSFPTNTFITQGSFGGMGIVGRSSDNSRIILFPFVMCVVRIIVS